MKVSPSGYYAWIGRKESPRSQQERELLAHIKTAYKQSKGTYGSPRVQQELRANGILCSRKRVARIMKKHHIRAVAPRRFQVTTDSKHALPVAQNLLNQEFACAVANTRWSCDITYLWTKEGWLYLSAVLDLYSRRVVGWSMQSSLERSLVLDALDMALSSRRPQPGRCSVTPTAAASTPVTTTREGSRRPASPAA